MIYLEATDYLSGVAIIHKNKVLMVLPKKYKDKGELNKWSFPKGHIETKKGRLKKVPKNKLKSPEHIDKSLKSAKKELKEEAGIKKNLGEYEVFKFEYKKGGVKKNFVLFVHRTDEEISSGKYREHEIGEIEYLTKEQAMKLAETPFKKMIEKIFSKRKNTITLENWMTDFLEFIS